LRLLWVRVCSDPDPPPLTLTYPFNPVQKVPSPSLPTWCRLAGLVAVSQHRCVTTDPYAAGFAEEVAAAVLEKLNEFKNAEHMAYLKCKLGE
jgi:hypothetical protein